MNRDHDDGRYNVVDAIAEGTHYLEKWAKSVQSIEDKIEVFTFKHPERALYFQQLDKTQKRLEDELAFLKVASSVIEDGLKLYNDKELQIMDDVEDAVRICKLASAGN